MAKMQRMLMLAVLMPILLLPGCVTVNLLEPPGPVQEVQLAGSGDSKVLLMDLSGVISSQEKEGLLPQPNHARDLQGGVDQGVEGRQSEGVGPAH